MDKDPMVKGEEGVVGLIGLCKVGDKGWIGTKYGLSEESFMNERDKSVVLLGETVAGMSS